jgi:hypothetical protein
VTCWKGVCGVALVRMQWGSVLVIVEAAWCGCADDVCLCCVCGCVVLRCVAVVCCAVCVRDCVCVGGCVYVYVLLAVYVASPCVRFVGVCLGPGSDWLGVVWCACMCVFG